MKDNKTILKILISVILISVIIYLVYKYLNKKDKYVKPNLQNNKTMINNLQNNQMMINNLQKQSISEKTLVNKLKQELSDIEFKIYQTEYYSSEYTRTKMITLRLLNHLIPNYTIVNKQMSRNYSESKHKLGYGYGDPKPGDKTYWQKVCDQLDLAGGSRKSWEKGADKIPEELGKSIGSILSAIYKGYKDEFSPTATAEMGVSIGLTVLNWCLAVGGFGFLQGPISAIANSLLDAFKPKPSPPPYTIKNAVTDLKNYINDVLKMHDEAVKVEALGDSIIFLFNQINGDRSPGGSGTTGFLIDYLKIKNDYRTACVPADTCYLDQEEDKCNFNYYNTVLTNCMEGVN